MERLYKKSSVKTYCLILGIALFLFQNSFAKEPEWYLKMKKITIFQSTRQDIERLFKFSSFKETSKSGWVQDVYYEIEGARISVGYSTGKCSLHPMLGYNVDENVVVGISIYSMEVIKMSKFDFDLSQFERYRVSDDIAIVWSNDDLGIQITGGEAPTGVKLVRNIEFYPTVTQKEKYKCANL